jgi:hypothetical protein
MSLAVFRFSLLEAKKLSLDNGLGDPFGLPADALAICAEYGTGHTRDAEIICATLTV